ncbi:MAG: hypothetical protein ABGX12_06250 [Desulfurobacteriaceae bacterium]
MKVKVILSDRSFPVLYGRKPSELFRLFEEAVKDVLEEVEPKKVTNRAFHELMRRRGRKKLKRLKRRFSALDRSSPYRKKVIYNAFYRVFKRLDWARSSGSEREIELKVWVTSSVDFLCHFVDLLEKLDG